jgi:hypothetical protein
LGWVAACASHHVPGELNFLPIFSRSSLLSTHVSTNPQDVQMNHDVYTAPKAVRFMGIMVPHNLRLETLISVEVHFGQTPVCFKATLLLHLSDSRLVATPKPPGKIPFRGDQRIVRQPENDRLRVSCLFGGLARAVLACMTGAAARIEPAPPETL